MRSARTSALAPARALVVAVAVAAAACSSLPDVPEVDDAGDVVEVFTNYRGAEAEAFRDVLAAFTERTGIVTRHVGTAALAERLPQRLRNGDAPGVALVPQPALVAELAREGHLVPIDDAAGDVLTLHTGTEDIGVVDGVRYGVWYRMSVKSLVWYPPEAFRDAGYEPPVTLGQLLGVTRQAEDAGATPWCLGVESFGATGWVGTDWVEDLVLRLHGPELYDRWAAGEVSFTDPRIAEAFESFGTVALGEGFVLGGPRAALRTPALAAIDPMLDDPPACLLTRQASFQESSLPTDTVIGPEGAVDVFVLPPATEGPAPIVASGEIAVAFDDDEDTAALVAYLADAVSGEPWARVGGFTSPHASFDAGTYAEPFDARMGELVAAAEVVRFDASDQMPPPVGTGTFWRGIVDYLAGADLDVVLAEIDEGFETPPPTPQPRQGSSDG